jgi:hypothetical protein
MTAAFLAIPTAGILLAIDPRQIDYARARGQSKKDLLLRHRGYRRSSRIVSCFSSSQRYFCFIWQTRSCCRN